MPAKAQIDVEAAEALHLPASPTREPRTPVSRLTDRELADLITQNSFDSSGNSALVSEAFRRGVQRRRNVAASAPSVAESSTMPLDAMLAEVERLRAENETLKSQIGRAGRIRISAKGGVSVYGLGRFPVTLYQEQWLKLLALADEIRAFIEENSSRLKTKGH